MTDKRTKMGKQGATPQPVTEMGKQGATPQPVTEMGRQGATPQPATEVGRQGVAPQPVTEICQQGFNTKPVVDLLTSILSEVHKQVVSPTPRALDGDAVQAIQLFREIRSALALQPAPSIVFRADPTALPVGGGIAKLTWASSAAQAVVIDQAVGEVTPAAGGTIAVNVAATTTFTATAVNPCGSAAAPATVTVATLQ